MKGMKGMGSKFGLGVDTSIDHDTSKSAAAVKKAIDAPTTKLTKGGNVPMGSDEDIAEVKKINPTTSTTSNTAIPELAAPETQMGNLGAKFDARDTRQNKDMQNIKNSMDSSAQKNVSRGHYMGDMSSTTNVGQLKTQGEWNPITKTETYGNITKPGGGTAYIPKGKGSSATIYEVAMEDEAPEGYGEKTIEAGDYQGYVAPEKTGKQKRQAKRKTKQTARLKKQGERTDAKIMKNNPEYKGLSY